MSRPRVYHERRVQTSVRLPEGLHARLHAEAEDREVGVNLMVVRAIEHYLDALVPADQVLDTDAGQP